VFPNNEQSEVSASRVRHCELTRGHARKGEAIPRLQGAQVKACKQTNGMEQDFVGNHLGYPNVHFIGRGLLRQ